MMTCGDIAHKVSCGSRLTAGEALVLWREAPLWLLGRLAAEAKYRASGDKVFYNRNFHIEPTNVCNYNCRFCSYRRPKGAPDAWDWTPDEIENIARSRSSCGATEVHIVGGAHPDHDLWYWAEVVRRVKRAVPSAAIKAFTAVELLFMSERTGVAVSECLRVLKEAGLEALPGGGAEIFAAEIRRQICPEKCSGEEWLSVHGTAHGMGIRTNATMLYGHVESIEHRIDHLLRLRAQQDATGGFDAFVPLRYRRANNPLGATTCEVSVVEDLRTLAMSRLLLDNIPHIKAYWVMYGKQTAELALSFGADDIDGTIDDSTKIYSMAGAEEQKPSLTIAEIEGMALSAGLRAVERDTFYNELNSRPE